MLSALFSDPKSGSLSFGVAALDVKARVKLSKSPK